MDKKFHLDIITPTSIESFDNIDTWLKQTETQPKAKIVICGNKSDLKPKIKSLSCFKLGFLFETILGA